MFLALNFAFFVLVVVVVAILVEVMEEDGWMHVVENFLTSLNPFCSKRLMISLTRPRWTPSLRNAEESRVKRRWCKRGGCPRVCLQAACVPRLRLFCDYERKART